MTSNPPAYWGQAQRELAVADPTMATLIRDHEGALSSRGDAFQTLVRSIVGQQISVRAADAVWARFCAAFVAEPGVLSAADESALRACGLSLRKSEYVRDLARHFVDGRIDPERFPALDDTTLINELVDVRGIGVWTAEMFLIFHLLRPDVWPVDDIGLQKAAASLYADALDDRKLTRRELQAFGERFRPWRSVATWYLWRALDPVPVAY